MAIWNPRTGTWDNDETDNQVWNPSKAEWVSNVSPTTKKSEQKTVKKEKKSSFLDTTKQLSNTLNNSFVKNNGLNLSNAITDIANISDDIGNIKTSLPVAGNYFKVKDKVDKTILNTATNMGEGRLRNLEGILDTINKISDNVNNAGTYAVNRLINGKEVADKQLKKAKESSRKFIEKDLTTDLLNATGYNDEEFHKNFEDGSLVKRDNLAGQVAQGVGGMVDSLLAGQYLGLGTEVPNTALKGLKGLDKAKAIAKNLAWQGVSNLGGTTTLAGSTYGQSLQEAYQNGATDDQATRYAIGSTAKEIATEWITGGIPGLGGTGGLDKPVEKLIDKTTGKLKNEYAKAIAKSLMSYGYKFVGEGLEEGLSEIIDPYLKNATYSKDEKVNWEDVLNSFIVGGITGGILEAPNSVAEFNNNMVEANNNVLQNNATLPTGNSQYITNDIKGNPLVENNNSVPLPVGPNTMESINSSNNFIYESSDNSKIDNFRKSASQFMNNSNETKSFVQTVEKVINDKNYNITFDNTIGENVNGKISINENGEVDIRINPNSERAGEFILTHEITHAIETNDMRELVMDYAKKNNDFNNALESLKETYGTTEVSDEVLADISGQMLGSEEFINKLSTSKPNIFKRIYDSIISLANKITGNSRESLFMKDLKNKWQKAYKEANIDVVKQNLGKDSKYMVTGKKGAKELSKLTKNDMFVSVYKEAIKMYKNNKSMKEIREKTGWYKDVNGDWKFEISDENSKIKIKPKPNHKYKLGDLLQHNYIYKMYPNANNIKIEFKNMDNKNLGHFDKIKGVIQINNNLTNNYVELEDTLLHELQHFIQKKENFQSGTNPIFAGGFERYKNDLGETEAREVYKRKNMSFDDRIKNPSKTQNYNKNSSYKLYTKSDNNIYNGIKNIFKSGDSYVEKNKSNNKKTTLSVDDRQDVDKFSLKENNWQEHLEKNYKSPGTKTHFEDTRNNNIDTEQNLIDKETNKIVKKHENEQNRSKKIITKEASKILEFDDYKQKRKFTELISEYYDNPNYEKIKQDIKDNFGEKRIEYVNDYIKDIKSEIRKVDLKVPDYIKRGIVDYNSFRKENLGSLNLRNKGQSIDSFYNEMSELYPSIFSKDISNEIDQLKRLSEFMSEDSSIFEKYNLDEEVINEAADYVYESIKNQDNIDDLINSISISPKQIRKEKTVEYREFAENFLDNSDNWKDKKMGLSYKTNTMKRNFYDVMGKRDGGRLYRNFIEPIFNHNAQMQNDISNYNDRINKLKLNDKESIAVQMFGEYKYNPETLVTGPEIEDFISKNNLDHKKIENAVEVFRSTYDELIGRVNETLKAQGYKEIDYRKGYFPHFVDEGATTKFGKVLEKMGWKFKDDSVPTDIAGITDTFKPGKVWNRNAQQRRGKYTDFNALKGFDNYVRGAMETIYFTEDIQRLRALENEIRYQHSEKGVQNQIDEIMNDNSLDFEERQDKIDKIFAKYVTPLNNLVSEIRDYTNGIANKKSILDRTMEQSTNRKVYSVMQNVSSRLSANMVGLNLSSAITNFIPITQATSQVKSKYLLKGLQEAIKNQAVNDNFESKSVFLTSRLNEADRLYKTKLESFSEKANFMFDGIDSITSNTIVRGKYYENIANGMSEYNAIRNADEFARDLMAGRTKGEMPTIFNSKNPLIKLFTSFQLEVNNQYQYMLKDLPRDLGDETKKKLISAFVKMFFGAWIYNQLTEKVVGRKAAFSPADTIKEIYDTATNKNLKITDKSSNILETLTQDIPFVGGLVGGGRLPISSVANPLKVIKGESTIKEEAKKLGYYTILPFGGGQLKKTVEGAELYKKSINPFSKDFLKEREVSGSYTNKGKLRFEAKKDVGSVTKNILFGQYSSKETQDYFSKGYLPIDSKTVGKLQSKGVTISEYRKYTDDSKELGLNEIKSDKDSDGKAVSGSASAKKAYKIMNSDYSKKEKNYLLSTLSSNNENPIDVKEIENLPNDERTYKFYFGLNKDGRKKFKKELDNYNISSDKLIDFYNTRKKYNSTYTSSVTKDKIMNYLSSSNLDEKTKWYLYSKDYGSDSLKKIVDTFNLKTDDYFNVMKYSNDISYKYQGDKNSSKRKQLVFNYINNLKISNVQKTILFKQAGYSNSSGKKLIFNYIDSMKISKTEKQKLYNSIF